MQFVKVTLRINSTITILIFETALLFIDFTQIWIILALQIIFLTEINKYFISWLNIISLIKKNELILH
mgnify:CR=1 FL=1